MVRMSFTRKKGKSQHVKEACRQVLPKEKDIPRSFTQWIKLYQTVNDFISFHILMLPSYNFALRCSWYVWFLYDSQILFHVNWKYHKRITPVYWSRLGKYRWSVTQQTDNRIVRLVFSKFRRCYICENFSSFDYDSTFSRTGAVNEWNWQCESDFSKSDCYYRERLHKWIFVPYVCHRYQSGDIVWVSFQSSVLFSSVNNGTVRWSLISIISAAPRQAMLQAST